MGLLTDVITPSNHFGPLQKLHTYTLSPSSNDRSSLCRSCPTIWWLWLAVTQCSSMGCIRSKWEHGRHSINSWAGEILVVVCEVIWYWNRNRDKHVRTAPSVVFLSPDLNVWTARSARPLEAGWYGATVTTDSIMFQKPLELCTLERWPIIKHQHLG